MNRDLDEDFKDAPAWARALRVTLARMTPQPVVVVLPLQHAGRSRLMALAVEFPFGVPRRGDSLHGLPGFEAADSVAGLWAAPYVDEVRWGRVGGSVEEAAGAMCPWRVLLNPLLMGGRKQQEEVERALTERGWKRFG